MRITILTFIGFQINSAIDSGKYDHITLIEVRDQIDAGTIFEFLRKELHDDIDLSILEDEKAVELQQEWQDMLSAIDERRKMGVERKGLPLLMAYLLEGIQRRQDSNPKTI